MAPLGILAYVLDPGSLIRPVWFFESVLIIEDEKFKTVGRSCVCTADRSYSGDGVWVLGVVGCGQWRASETCSEPAGGREGAGREISRKASGTEGKISRCWVGIEAVRRQPVYSSTCK